MVIPFGLKNAPEAFRRMMDEILGETQNEIVCVNNILVRSMTVQEQVEHLGFVFDKLRGGDLKVKFPKCHFLNERVRMLGFVESGESVTMYRGKVSTILGVPVPVTKTEVREVLGLASYYRCLIEGFSEKAGPLHDGGFVFGSHQEAIFGELKRADTTAPVQAQPTLGRKFSVHTDASATAVVGVLSQDDDGGLVRP